MRDLPIINGVKCYPTCSWEENQHKIYNALDRAWNDYCDCEDEEEKDRLISFIDRLETLLGLFNNHIVGYMVYLPYEWYKFCKDVIGAYDMRH